MWFWFELYGIRGTAYDYVQGSEDPHRAPGSSAIGAPNPNPSVAVIRNEGKNQAPLSPLPLSQDKTLILPHVSPRLVISDTGALYTCFRSENLWHLVQMEHRTFLAFMTQSPPRDIHTSHHRFSFVLLEYG